MDRYLGRITDVTPCSAHMLTGTAQVTANSAKLKLYSAFAVLLLTFSHYKNIVK